MPPENRLDELTTRELEVLDLVRLGLTNEEIAGRLGITEAGAKCHVSQILSKLGVSSRDEAAATWTGKPRLRGGWRALWPALAMMFVGVVMLVIAGFAALAMMTGADSEDGARVSSEPTPIPWVDSTPARTVPPTPFPTPDPVVLAVEPCRSDDVAAAMIHGQPEGGWILSSLGFTNTSAKPCRLQGVPQVRLLDDNGRAFMVAIDATDPCMFDPECVPGAPVILQPGAPPPMFLDRLPTGQAVVGMMFGGGRDRTPCATRATALELILPEVGGALRIPVDGINGCVEPSTGQFVPTGPGPSPLPTPQRLRVEIELPSLVTAGRPVEFLAVLRNVSDSVVAFSDPCPNYTVLLEPQKKAVTWHSLNCEVAGPIEPGGSLSFAMVVDLISLPAGDYTLGWQLELNEGPLEATALLTLADP